jgi:23S rRNA (uracil1939-C5)-methyltransferase
MIVELDEKDESDREITQECKGQNYMFEKGQEYKVRIEDVSDQGQGIGKIDGFTVFVGDALPGDVVVCELMKVKKRFALARMVEMLEASPDRINPACEYTGECGGCAFMEYDYSAQLRLKRKQVKDKLTRLGGIEEPLVREAVGMTDAFGNESNGVTVPWRYRNKAVLQVDVAGSVGFFMRKSRYVVDCADCLLQMPSVAAAADALREFLNTGGLKTGEKIKSMTVRTAVGTGEVMVILDCSGLTDIERLAELLDDAVYEAGYSLESIYYDEGGKEPVLIAGKPTIDEVLSGIRFEISPRSFYQVNPEMMCKLYDIVADYADVMAGDTILDLYCGAGSIGLWLLERYRNQHEEANDPFVLGIESEKQAILDANRNAVINGIVNARYILGKAEEVLPELVSKEGEETVIEETENKKRNETQRKKYDDDLVAYANIASVAVIDPPRSGCRPELIEAVAKAAPEKIVYVSCDPATLARDIKHFYEKGYQFREATPVDMFPHTGHVEVVSILQRMSSTSKKTITLDVDMEDYHRIKSEGR